MRIVMSSTTVYNRWLRDTGYTCLTVDRPHMYLCEPLLYLPIPIRLSLLAPLAFCHEEQYPGETQ